MRTIVRRRRKVVWSCALAVLVQLPSLAQEAADAGEGVTRWPGFRGDGTNISQADRLPVSWSDDTVAWRSATPAFGQSTPVIWDGMVFVTSIEGAMKERLWVSSLDLRDGRERWRRAFDAAERHEFNDYVSKAAPTPAVDEHRVYTFFASGDLIALGHDGEVHWRRDLAGDHGSVGGNHGVGNSLLLTQRAVVVLLTRRTYSYLMAVDPGTGDTLWRTEREPGVAWSTPALSPDGTEIVVSASGRIEGFDAESGQRRWHFAGLSGNHVPSPTVTDELVVVGGLAVEANLAIRRGGRGELDDAAVAWRAGGGSNFGSPFAYGECIYWVNPAGAARCLTPGTGEVQWTHRLPESTWATPLGHREHVYFFGEDGATVVLRASADGAVVVATNHLSVSAPVTAIAAVDDAIVIRAGTEIIRIGSDDRNATP
jgi:outer membrane protein assembly factor BamB